MREQKEEKRIRFFFFSMFGNVQKTLQKNTYYLRLLNLNFTKWS